MAEDDSSFHFVNVLDSDTSAAPLILIHDGGGTAFNYHLLGPLQRSVFAISNPHFDSGEPWPGGLPQMGKRYAQMIHGRVPPGPIIIGGWSLGGMIALELASQLRHDASYDILGIVMLDTPYPKLYKTLPDGVRTEDLNIFSSTTRPKTRAKVKQCVAHARDMIVSWQLPDWPEPELNTEVRKDSRRLPAIFLHAKGYVPVEIGPPGTVAEVDYHRQDPKLGWNRYRFLDFLEVRDVEGHHFSVFAMDQLDNLTQSFELSCIKLEEHSMGLC